MLPKLPLFLFCFILSACATIRGRSHRVKIVTDPPGTEVVFKGESLGTTPGFFQIKREKDVEILLKKPGYKEKTYSLGTSYRFADSLFSNLIWAPFFYVGWVVASGVDWNSGAAFDIDKPEVISLESVSVKPAPESERQWNLVVAPPQDDHELVSDEIGEKVTPLLRRNWPQHNVVNYRDTRNVFETFDYTNKEMVSPRFEDPLYYQLGATHIYESRVFREDNQVQVVGDVKNIFTEKKVATFNTVLKTSDLETTKRGWFSRFLLSFVKLVPNAVAIEPGSQAKVTAYNYRGYSLVGEPPPGYWSAFSNISLRNLKSPKLVENLKFISRWVPLIQFSYTPIRFLGKDSPEGLKERSFHWHAFNLGVGAEIGLETAIGYPYIQAIPYLHNSHISWDTNTRTESGLGVMAEFGHSVFVTEDFNLSLFFRIQGEPASQWAQTVSQYAEDSALSGTLAFASRTSAGISIAYYWPEIRQKTKRLFY